MTFTVSFPLVLEKWQKDYLNKKLFIMARLYNETLYEYNGRKQLIQEILDKDTEYTNELIRVKVLEITEKEKIKLLTENKKAAIKRHPEIPTLSLDIISREFVTPLRAKRPQYEEYLNTGEITQTILRGSLKKAVDSKGEIKYKVKKDGLTSFVSQVTKTGCATIKFNPITCSVLITAGKNKKVLTSKISVGKNDKYGQDVLSQIRQRKDGTVDNYSCSQIRIKRQKRKNKDYYYLELVLKDTVDKPKLHKPAATGNRVGVDIGATTVAWWDGQQTYQEQLGSAIKLIQQSKSKQRVLQRKLDRQRRINNPDNYNENGTIKKGYKKWNNSNNYFKTQGQLQDISHKIKVQRKELLDKLANEIIECGDHVLVEKMDWKEIAKKEKSAINPDTGRHMPVKKFGKLIGENAPATLTETIKRKLGYIDGIYDEVNTYDTALSQLNHITGERIKKQLSQRETRVGGELVGRDTYAALGIRNVDTSGKKHEVSIQGMNHDWDSFLEAEKYRYKDVSFRMANGEKLSRAMIPDSLVRT